MRKYTWGELVDANEFEHSQKFVTIEDYRYLEQRLKQAEDALSMLYDDNDESLAGEYLETYLWDNKETK